jgi:CRP-like cAMP-binding protein
MNLPPEENYYRGDLVIEQGEPAMEAFLIMKGQAEVRLKKDGKITVLATLKEGDIFGETAFFRGSDYGASVYADGPLTVQRIPPPVLDEKIAQCDPMIRALIRMLMSRLRQTNHALSEHKTA